MDFQLSDEQRMLAELAGDFARREILPRAAQLDREERFPRELYEKARELGLVNLTIPQEYGPDRARGGLGRGRHPDQGGPAG
ncbi:MAG TPA: acyl-CoA dehydrogenase family protein [Thermaerobacter sp.]